MQAGQLVKYLNRGRSLNVDMRCVFCYRVRQEGVPYQLIGDYLGMNHASVIHLCGKMRDALDYPFMFQGLVEKYNWFDSLLTEC